MAKFRLKPDDEISTTYPGTGEEWRATFNKNGEIAVTEEPIVARLNGLAEDESHPLRAVKGS